MGAGGGICEWIRAELLRPGFSGGGGGSCEDFSGGRTTGAGAAGAGATTAFGTLAGGLTALTGFDAAFGAGFAAGLGAGLAALAGATGFFGAGFAAALTGLATGLALTAGFLAAGFTGDLGTGFFAAAGLAIFLAAGFTTALTAFLATGFTAFALTAGLAALTGVFVFFAGAFTQCLLWMPLLSLQQKTWLQSPSGCLPDKPGYCSRRAIVAADCEAVTVLKQTVGESIQTWAPPRFLALFAPNANSLPQTRHCSRPCIKISLGRSMPMKTILLLRFSPSPQAGPRSLPMSWCTPWKMTLRSVPSMFSTPL